MFMSDLKSVTKCRACGSSDLQWHCSQNTSNGIVNGRLNLNDVHTEFFLGCNECSETLCVENGDVVAKHLSESEKQTVTLEQKLDEANELLAKIYESGVNLEGLEKPVKDYLTKPPGETECSCCGNECSKEQISECPHCFGEKCPQCDMGDDVACMSCE
jgi:hypothetical protein